MLLTKYNDFYPHHLEYAPLFVSLTWMLTNPEQIATWDRGEIHLGFCAPTVELLKILAERTHLYFCYSYLLLYISNKICQESKNWKLMSITELLLQNNIAEK